MWISNLRAARKKRPDSSQVTAQHVAMLDEIGMEWDARTAKWECAYARAVEYRAAHGSLLVPVNYKTEDGFCLGDWVRRMREARPGEGPQAHREPDPEAELSGHGLGYGLSVRSG